MAAVEIKPVAFLFMDGSNLLVVLAPICFNNLWSRPFHSYSTAKCEKRYCLCSAGQWENWFLNIWSTFSIFLLYVLIEFSFRKCLGSCKTITALHLCHKPTGAVRVPCGLVVLSVPYMYAIMLMSVQLHNCPLWPSVVLPAIDQGRVSSARSGTPLWWIYHLLVQACSVFPDESSDSLLPLY